jgi:endonuclease III related protein
MKLRLVYKRLLACHGPQGWWPIINPLTLESEYFVNAPRSKNDFFEIAVGAILTQNVSWSNVVKAVSALKRSGVLNPDSIRRIQVRRLAGMIRSTGYYNQKAKKIKNFIAWYGLHDYSYEALRRKDCMELRRELLEVNGIGPETADSILLYGLGRKIFVVDAYTKRVFSRLGTIAGDEKYHDIQNIFHAGFRGNAEEYNEYHALIVVHAKKFCKKEPSCNGCCLSGLCSYSAGSSAAAPAN